MLKLFFKRFFRVSRGFVALITVLIILAIALLVGLGVSFLSISEATMGLKKTQSSQAYFLANLCTERALMNLKDTHGAYTGETIAVSYTHLTLPTKRIV